MCFLKFVFRFGVFFFSRQIISDDSLSFDILTSQNNNLRLLRDRKPINFINIIYIFFFFSLKMEISLNFFGCFSHAWTTKLLYKHRSNCTACVSINFWLSFDQQLHHTFRCDLNRIITEKNYMVAREKSQSVIWFVFTFYAKMSFAGEYLSTIGMKA